MKGWSRLAVLSLTASTWIGCGPEVVEPLPPAEVFNWGGQPISFSPPPEGWRREKEQSGGLRGVRFVKSGSVGERVHVAEHFQVGDRDRCGPLQAMLRDLDNFDDRAFRGALQHARLFASTPINADETRLIAEANTSLDEAARAFWRDDLVKVRRAISKAYEQATHIHYSLDEVVDRVMLPTDHFQSLRLPPRFERGEPQPGELAGEPTVRVDYDLEYGGRVYRGREIYLVKNNRLFVASYQGLEENLPLFDRIVETISFPASDCAH